MESSTFEESLGKVKRGFAAALQGGGNDSTSREDEESFFGESVRGVSPTPAETKKYNRSRFLRTLN